LAGSIEWTSVKNRPLIPGGPITISDVVGLQAALDSNQNKSGLARVAYTGQWNDILGKPAFGSAAFVDVDAFVAAYTGKTLQVGSINLVAGQQSYAVAFTRTMNAVPKVMLQHFMANDSGEIFFCSPQDDSLTADGFTFWLNGVPLTSTGRVQYWAVVQSQPA
jgi:hypothetical protein